MAERTYTLAFGRDYLNPRTERKVATAERIIDAFRKFHVIPLTQAEYAALDARGKAIQKKASGFVIGGDFGEGKRKEDCVSRSIVTLDLDDLTTESAAQVIWTLQDLGHRGFIYSTASHTVEKPRLRAFIFLASDVLPDQYSPLVQYFANVLPTGAVSSETYKLSQVMYRPQACSDGVQVFIELTGEPLDPLPILANVTPTEARKSEATPAWDKPGIVGKVAARYEGDFDRAIEELNLPYTRSAAGPTCAVGEDRYTYTKGAGADGAVWYAKDGHLYSHHGTDPARGQNCTIFDVYRLHNCHPEADDESASIAERASHKAAEAFFAGKFPELARQPASSEELEDLTAEEPGNGVTEYPKQGNPLRFTPIPAEQFIGGGRLKWWVKFLIPQAELGLLFGDSGAGKSFVAYDIATAIHVGGMWNGKKVIQGKNLYVCAEGTDGFRQRVEARAMAGDHDIKELPPVIPAAPNVLESGDVMDLILAIKAEKDVAVVWLDTLAAVTPGADENISTDMGRLIANCKLIHRKTGAMVILVHHTGKDLSKGARGHSSIRAAMDVMLEVVRNNDVRKIGVYKAKDGEDREQMMFGLKRIVLGIDEDGDEISSCVPEYFDGPIVAALKPLNPAQETVFSEVRRLIQNGVTKARDIYDIAKLKLPVDEDDKRDRRNQQVRRLIAQIVDKGGRLYLHNGGESISLSPATEGSVAEFEE